MERGKVMTPRLLAGSAIVSLCLGSIAPAAAQDYRYAGFDAPRGANATLNLRVPLGHPTERRRPTIGFTLGYGQIVGAPTPDGRPAVRQLRLADLRFSDRGLANARVASFDLANPGQATRLNLGGGKKSFLLYGAIVVAGVVICLAADCFGGSDDEPDQDMPSQPATPTPPG
jgi:hypothetical protein